VSRLPKIVTRFEAHDRDVVFHRKCVTLAKSWHVSRNPDLGNVVIEGKSGHDYWKSCHDWRCIFAYL